MKSKLLMLFFGVTFAVAVAFFGYASQKPCFFGCTTVESLKQFDWMRVYVHPEAKAATICSVLTGHDDAPACAGWNPRSKTCHIVLPDTAPKKMIWHEAKHCIDFKDFGETSEPGENHAGWSWKLPGD